MNANEKIVIGLIMFKMRQIIITIQKNKKNPIIEDLEEVWKTLELIKNYEQIIEDLEDVWKTLELIKNYEQKTNKKRKNRSRILKHN